MISIHTDKKLNIILPNTNKALAKVLKDATPKELEVIRYYIKDKSLIKQYIQTKINKEIIANIKANELFFRLFWAFKFKDYANIKILISSKM